MFLLPLYLSDNKQGNTYPRENIAFSVKPVTAAAMANMNVVNPNEACIGTKDALNPAVAPSQHRRTRKLKNPTTNWKEKKYVSSWTSIF